MDRKFRSNKNTITVILIGLLIFFPLIEHQSFSQTEEKKELRKSKDYKITLYIISEVTSHAI